MDCYLNNLSPEIKFYATPTNRLHRPEILSEYSKSSAPPTCSAKFAGMKITKTHCFTAVKNKRHIWKHLMMSWHKTPMQAFKDSLNSQQSGPGPPALATSVVPGQIQDVGSYL